MANRKRAKQIAVRVTEAEYEEIMLAIEKSGMSQQDFFIKAVTEINLSNQYKLQKSDEIPMCKTVAQYKIKQWVEQNFSKESVTLKFTEDNKAVITDQFSEEMKITYSREKGVYVDE